MMPVNVAMQFGKPSNILQGDSGGGSGGSFSLLWTNPSPNAAFAAQNISVDLSGYDLAAIYVKYSYNQDAYNPLYFIPLIDQTHYLFYTVHTGSANAVGARSCRYSPTDKKMIFGSNWHSGSTTNNYFIPVAIYGVKL